MNDARQPRRTLRVQTDGDTTTFSWPVFAAWGGRHAGRQRATASCMLIGFSVFLTGLAVALLFTFGKSCSHPEHQYHGTPGWQAQLSQVLLPLAPTALVFAFAAMPIMLRFARMRIRIEPRRLTVSMRQPALSPSQLFDPETAECLRQVSFGVEQLFLRQDGRVVSIGAGLATHELDEIQTAMERTMGRPCGGLDPSTPVRFELKPGAASSRLTIARSIRPFSISVARILCFVLIPFLPLFVSAISLQTWALHHDTVVMEHYARMQEQRKLRSDTPSMLQVETLICAFAMLAASTLRARTMRASSALEVSPAGLTVESGTASHKRESYSRADLGEIHIDSTTLNLPLVRSVSVMHNGKKIVLHSLLALEEARWLANWINAQWPETRIVESAPRRQ